MAAAAAAHGDEILTADVALCLSLLMLGENSILDLI